MPVINKSLYDCGKEYDNLELMYKDMKKHHSKYNNQFLAADDPRARLIGYVCMKTNMFWEISIKYLKNTTKELRENIDNLTKTGRNIG